MVVLFYNIIIAIYSAGIRFASLFNDKARMFYQGRKNLLKGIEEKMAGSSQKVIWVHCASLGEFEQGRPVIEWLKEKKPDYPIVLTFYSPSGYTVRKNYALADHVFYLPVDTAAKARQFIRLINPSLVIFVKYEFWYHYITFLRDNNIPILSISSIFRPDHIFFKFYGGFFREMLKKVDHFFVQNEESVSLLHKLGIKGVTNSGDTRFDRVYQLREQEIKLPLIEKFKGEDKLLILGSIWTTDMDRIAGFVNTVAEKESIKIILAPHEIQEANIRRQLKDIRLSFIKYSEANEENVSKARLLIIDNIGMLSTLYRYGDYAYIGGSFGVGLHNILEAATFGLPLFFGSQNFKRFREANELIKLGGAFPISSSEELMKVFQHVSQEEEKIRVLNSQYVQENTGATEKIVNYCLTLLENGRDRH